MGSMPTITFSAFMKLIGVQKSGNQDSFLKENCSYNNGGLVY